MGCRVCVFSLKSNSFCHWLLINFLYKHWVAYFKKHVLWQSWLCCNGSVKCSAALFAQHTARACRTEAALCLSPFLGRGVLVRLCCFHCSSEARGSTRASAWHHFATAAFLGKLVKRRLAPASTQMWYRVRSQLLPQLVIWKSISILQYSPEEITCCGLEGTTPFWVLDFTVSFVSFSFPLSTIACLMELLQGSECQHGRVSLLHVPRQGEYWPKGHLISPRREFLVFSRLLPILLVWSHLCKTYRWSLPLCRQPELIFGHMCENDTNWWETLQRAEVRAWDQGEFCKTQKSSSSAAKSTCCLFSCIVFPTPYLSLIASIYLLACLSNNNSLEVLPAAVRTSYLPFVLKVCFRPCEISHHDVLWYLHSFYFLRHK